MKLFLITNNTDTFAGMRLAGVGGKIVHTDDEFMTALSDAMKDEDIGIILIMDALYAKHSEHILRLKLTHAMPLIVSIPERGGSAAITEAVSNYIETAIGMKI